MSRVIVRDQLLYSVVYQSIQQGWPSRTVFHAPFLPVCRLKVRLLRYPCAILSAGQPSYNFH